MRWHYIGSGLYSKRLKDGSVRVIRVDGDPIRLADVKPEDLSLDITIKPGQWAQLVSSMSKAGETPQRFEAARAFHQL